MRWPGRWPDEPDSSVPGASLDTSMRRGILSMAVAARSFGRHKGAAH